LTSLLGLLNNQRVGWLLQGAIVRRLGGSTNAALRSAGLTNGQLAIRPLGTNQLELIRISGSGEFAVRRPYKVSGALASCEAFDVEGQKVTTPECRDTGAETRIKPVANAVRCVLRFAR
jgi:hypothetical protein